MPAHPARCRCRDQAPGLHHCLVSLSACAKPCTLALWVLPFLLLCPLEHRKLLFKHCLNLLWRRLVCLPRNRAVLLPGLQKGPSPGMLRVSILLGGQHLLSQFQGKMGWWLEMPAKPCTLCRFVQLMQPAQPPPQLPAPASAPHLSGCRRPLLSVLLAPFLCRPPPPCLGCHQQQQPVPSEIWQTSATNTPWMMTMQELESCGRASQ